MKKGILLFVVSVTAIISVNNVWAGSFRQASPSSIVVVRIGDGNNPIPNNSSTAVFLDEYDIRPASPILVNTIVLPSTAPNSLTLSTVSGWYDGHLRISTNNQYITIGGYRIGVGSLYDPTGEYAVDVPRVIGRIDMNGNIDTSTALTDAFDWGAIRSAVTDDGSRFWLAGDNASGANDGGLRFALLGATTSENLSHTQIPGSSNPSTDNVRDIAIADNQLYACSGSNSSIGKGSFKVGEGLPTSGSQSYTRLYTQQDSAQTLAFLDLNPSVPGVDVLYTASSNPQVSMRKYSFDGNTWVFNGYLDLPGINHVSAVNYENKVVIFATTDAAVYKFVDNADINSALIGSFGSPAIPSNPNIRFRGVEYLPVNGDTNLDGVVNLIDFTVLANHWRSAGDLSWNTGDLTGDKKSELDDVMVLADNWLAKAGI